MEKLERNNDKKQEWNEWYHFASHQELEFKCYTLNSAVLQIIGKSIAFILHTVFTWLIRKLTAIKSPFSKAGVTKGRPFCGKKLCKLLLYPIHSKSKFVVHLLTTLWTLLFMIHNNSVCPIIYSANQSSDVMDQHAGGRRDFPCEPHQARNNFFEALPRSFASFWSDSPEMAWPRPKKAWLLRSVFYTAFRVAKTIHVYGVYAGYSTNGGTPWHIWSYNTKLW